MEFMVPTFGDDAALIPATEKLRRSFHQYALRALDNEAGDFAPMSLRMEQEKKFSCVFNRCKK